MQCMLLPEIGYCKHGACYLKYSLQKQLLQNFAVMCQLKNMRHSAVCK